MKKKTKRFISSGRQARCATEMRKPSFGDGEKRSETVTQRPSMTGVRCIRRAVITEPHAESQGFVDHYPTNSFRTKNAHRSYGRTLFRFAR